jgi:A/G-specific adenine glycosylase
LAAGLLPSIRVGDFNQALMELGARVCTPEYPKCGACPLQKSCQALPLNKVADFPTPQPKAAIMNVKIEVALIKKNGKYLIAKRNGDRYLQSMWEFPQMAPAQLGLATDKTGNCSKIRHSIMNRRIQLKPTLYHYIGGAPQVSKEYVAFQWIFKEDLKNFPTSSLNAKILKNILSAKSRRPAES